MKLWFSLNCQTRRSFFQEFKYFFSIGVSHTAASLRLLLLLKFEKNFPKRLITRKRNFYIKQCFFPNKRNNLSPFRTDVPIRFHALRTVGAGGARNREIVREIRNKK